MCLHLFTVGKKKLNSAAKLLYGMFCLALKIPLEMWNCTSDCHSVQQFPPDSVRRGRERERDESDDYLRMSSEESSWLLVFDYLKWSRNSESKTET